jgi:hypothetical protein
MKMGASMCLLGAAMMLWALWDDAVLSRFDRLLLERELQDARAHGHPIALIVERVGPNELARLASARSLRGRVTVLALGYSDALILPSTTDSSIAAADVWTHTARHVAGPYLGIGDLQGAAAAIVRLYSRELATKGILPWLPPRRPIDLPDLAPRQPRPSDTPAMGLGIVLVIMGAVRWVRARWHDAREHPSAGRAR